MIREGSEILEVFGLGFLCVCFIFLILKFLILISESPRV